MALSYSAETPRLWLEPLIVEKHVHDFRELWTDPEAVKWSIKDVKTTLADILEWMPNILPNEENPDIDKFALLIRPTPQNMKVWEEVGVVNAKGDAKMVGIVGTNRWSDQGMEVGYCVNKAYWGKGVATEAFSAFLKMYWEKQERKSINKLVAKVHPDNIASQKVLKKCGGREGEVRKMVSLRSSDNGIESDEYCYYFDRPGFEQENLKADLERISVNSSLLASCQLLEQKKKEAENREPEKAAERVGESS